ncbi:MAG: hypothetical protein KGR26_00620, partial [Cyanobacteria bacterium REEB65]|nr:hypothetical protein [Cyanobacteria bacterium REEB65]
MPVFGQMTAGPIQEHLPVYVDEPLPHYGSESNGAPPSSGGPMVTPAPVAAPPPPAASQAPPSPSPPPPPPPPVLPAVAPAPAKPVLTLLQLAPSAPMAAVSIAPLGKLPVPDSTAQPIGVMSTQTAGASSLFDLTGALAPLVNITAIAKKALTATFDKILRNPAGPVTAETLARAKPSFGQLLVGALSPASLLRTTGLAALIGAPVAL